MTSENALERFVRKTRELFAAEPDPERRWTSLSPALAELLADPEVLDASKSWPDCVAADGRAENLIFYEDPEFGFAINGLTPSAPAPLRQTPPHPRPRPYLHALRRPRRTRARRALHERLDDSSKPDYAEIRQTDNIHVGPGEINLVKPYEIHTEITVGERTVAVIIRSEKAGGFNQGRFEPETNRYYESLGPRQTPAEMLPRKAQALEAAIR